MKPILSGASTMALGLFVSLSVASGCAVSTDEPYASEPEALEDDLPLHGYLPVNDINRYNTRYRTFLRYGQWRTVENCTTPIDRHPPAYHYRRSVTFCLVTFEAGENDIIGATLRNTDTWGTGEVRAYLVDPYDRIIDTASFDAPDHGYNTGRSISVRLSGQGQLERGGVYGIAFTKFLLPGAETDEDDFQVSVYATTAEEQPITLATPPIKSGLYVGENANYYVEVLPPEPEDERRLDAWGARVYEEKLDCGRPKLIAEFEQLRCSNDWACWFARTKIGPSGGSWFLGSGAPAAGGPYDTIDFKYLGYEQEKLTWQRALPERERAAYLERNTCVIDCPPEEPRRSNGTYCDSSCRRQAWLEVNRPGPWSGRCPLVLNVAGEREITFLGASVDFDLDGAGTTPRDWVAPEHPFLALDRNGNGVIDDGRELFGSATLLEDSGLVAVDGFEALEQYDDNADGQVDAEDPIFHELLLWFDRDSDGVSVPEELSLLKFSGIESLSLETEAHPWPEEERAFIAFSSSFEERVCRDGDSMFLADVWFPAAE